MNDRDENFLARWSRVKSQTTREQAKPDNKTAPSTGEATGEPVQPDAGESFDISTLPPVESITAATDIRDFLRAGVPAELTKAALRQVWTSDPAIRDFVGIAENQWDFTDPTAIPGFGPMAPADDVADLVARAMGKLEDVPVAADAGATGESQVAASDPPAPEQSIEAAPSDAAANDDNSIAVQQNTDTARPLRRHGGALPV